MQSSEAWWPRLHQASAHSLYLHIPFCKRKCAYCDFASWATPADDPSMAAYRDALVRHIDEAEGLGLIEGVKTAYVGGGTPSLLGMQLGPLVKRVAGLGVLELSCEANPDSLSDEFIECLVTAGATRVSIGVQSLNNGELAVLGRLHDGSTARERVAAAVASGLDVSCDLMCALPLQTMATWEQTLEEVMRLGARHVSVYPLMIEEGTVFDERYANDECEWNSDEAQATFMKKAQAMLEDNGFKRYEVASYAKGGKQCDHNIAYWTGQPYLGLGTKASSMLTLEGYLRLSQASGMLPRPPRNTVRVRLCIESGRQHVIESTRLADLSYSIEFLNEAQAAAEDLMLGARLAAGLDVGLVEHAREVLGSSLDECLVDLVDDGLLDNSSGKFAPTQRGWLLGNEVFGRLWGLAPGEVATASC